MGDIPRAKKPFWNKGRHDAAAADADPASSSSSSSAGGTVMNRILVTLGMREDNDEALRPRKEYLDEFRKNLAVHMERQKSRGGKDGPKPDLGDISAELRSRGKQPRAPLPEYICFKIERRIELNEKLEETEEHLVISFRSDEARTLISKLSTLRHIPSIFVEDPYCYVSQLIPHISLLEFNHKMTKKENRALKGFIDYLNYALPDEIERIEEDISNGVIAFWDLWYIFKKGVRIVSKYEGEKVGSVVSDTQYSGCGGGFVVSGKIIKSAGHSVFETVIQCTLEEYSGKAPFERLPFHIMTDAEHAELTERGRTFRNVAVGHHFVEYKGFMLVDFGLRSYQVQGDGRIIVDQLNYSRSNPESRHATALQEKSEQEAVAEQMRIQHQHMMNQGLPAQQLQQLQQQKKKPLDPNDKPSLAAVLPDDKLFMTFPTIMGYSLKRKEWGQFFIAGISDIQFRTDAFDRLVLAADRKKLIEVLVANVSSCRWRDIINEKGESGCIILLHGPPGTGKTLTAEAIAETLKKPLYTVTAGQLGTDAKKLETSLQSHFDIGKQWDSVMLMDEADVFLEKRNFSDIERNAMVGIFLRVLEYFPGILFLTTNRVQSFDDAFHSRISLSMSYEPLDAQSRAIVYRNLSPVEMHSIDFERLAREYDINGRQIKNIVRLAIKIADSEKRQVQFEDFVSILQSHDSFEKVISMKN